MLDINEAYGTLNDEEKRKKYDVMGVEGVDGNFGDFDGFDGEGMGGQGFSGFSSGPGRTKMRFTTTSSGGGIDPQMFNVFFGSGSNNMFNFGSKDPFADMRGFGGKGKDPFGDNYMRGFGGGDPFADFGFGDDIFEREAKRQKQDMNRNAKTSSKKR